MKTSSLKTQAQNLVQTLERESGGQSLLLGKVVKTLKTTAVILNSAPELQVAVVQNVIETYAKLGTPKGRKVTEWFRKKSVPTAAAEVVRLLLGRRLPFTDGALAGMMEKMARVSYLSLVEFNKQLSQAAVKFAKDNGLSPRLRKAARQFADALAIRHVSAAEAAYWKEECGFPRAEDRKVAAILDELLAT
jgi:hypothetical protein